jgi:hypothetical protein
MVVPAPGPRAGACRKHGKLRMLGGIADPSILGALLSLPADRAPDETGRSRILVKNPAALSFAD